MEISRHEIYNIELEEYSLEVRYYPPEHRVEVATDELHPKEGMGEESILQDRLGLQYEADSYGEPAYNFIEVFLDDESGLGIEHEGDVWTLLEPRKP